MFRLDSGDLNNLSNFSEAVKHPFLGMNVVPSQFDSTLDEDIYASDEFRMYGYKIKRCSRTRSHDWMECPFAHRGERATRRDPRKVPYIAISCPAYRFGSCPRGDLCGYAHGVFEFWLHPSRYRTRACNAGRFCKRKVCFFAHTPEELRSEKKYACPHHEACRARMARHGSFGASKYGSGGSNEEGMEAAAVVMAASSSPPVSVSSPMGMRMDGGSYFDGVSEFLDSLRKLKIKDAANPSSQMMNMKGGGGIGDPDPEFPQFGWVSELVK